MGDKPGVSIFQGEENLDVQLQEQEENEAIEDEKRRKEELQNILTQLSYDISDDESSFYNSNLSGTRLEDEKKNVSNYGNTLSMYYQSDQTPVLDISRNVNSAKGKLEEIPQAKVLETNRITPLMSEQANDEPHIAHCYQTPVSRFGADQQQILYDVRLREIENLQREITKYSRQALLFEAEKKALNKELEKQKTITDKMHNWSAGLKVEQADTRSGRASSNDEKDATRRPTIIITSWIRTILNYEKNALANENKILALCAEVKSLKDENVNLQEQLSVSKMTQIDLEHRLSNFELKRAEKHLVDQLHSLQEKHKSEIDELNQVINEKDTKINTLKNELSQIHHRHENQSDKNSVQMENQMEIILSTEAAKRSLEIENLDLKKKINEFGVQLTLAQRENLKQKDSMTKKIQIEKERFCSVKASYNAEIEKLERIVKETNEQLERIVSESERSKIRINELISEGDRLRTDNNIQKQIIQDQTNEIEKLKTELNIALERCDKLVTKNEELQKENMASLQNSKKSLSNELQSLINEQNRKLDELNKQLISTNQEYDKLIIDCQKLKTELELVMKERDQLKNDSKPNPGSNIDLEQLKDEFSILRGQLEVLKSDLHRESIENKILRESLQKSESEKETIALTVRQIIFQHDMEIKELNDKCLKLTEENKNMEINKTSSNSSSEIDNLKKNIIKLNEENSKLELESKKHISQLVTRLNTMKSECDRLNNDNKMLNSVLTSYKSELTKITEGMNINDLSALKNENLKLTNEIKDLCSIIESGKQEQDTLKKQILKYKVGIGKIIKYHRDSNKEKINDIEILIDQTKELFSKLNQLYEDNENQLKVIQERMPELGISQQLASVENSPPTRLKRSYSKKRPSTVRQKSVDNSGKSDSKTGRKTIPEFTMQLPNKESVIESLENKNLFVIINEMKRDIDRLLRKEFIFDK